MKEAIEQGCLCGARTIFYLLAPMLIERSPADAWLSLCGLAFLVRCVVRRDWSWAAFLGTSGFGLLGLVRFQHRFR